MKVKLYYYLIGKMIIGKILKINYIRKVLICFEILLGSEYLFQIMIFEKDQDFININGMIFQI